MTTPPDGPRFEGPSFDDDAFENDPTGIRDLLRSLPDPGPMPQDISARITAALSAEQQARAGVDLTNVTPLLAAGGAARAKTGGRRWMQVAGGLVAAAAVAAVAVVGVSSLRHDTATTNALPTSSPTTATSHQLADLVQVTSSGTNYTGPSFNAQAASMAAGTSVSSPDPSVLTDFGSLAKPSAIAQCARSVGGALLDDPSSIKVDLATFDGKPAVVIVVTNHGTKSAFAVSDTCSRTTQPYAAPRTL